MGLLLGLAVVLLAAAAGLAEARRDPGQIAASWVSVGVAGAVWAAVPGPGSSPAGPAAGLVALAVGAVIARRAAGRLPSRSGRRVWPLLAAGRTLLLVGGLVGVAVSVPAVRPAAAGWLCGQPGPVVAAADLAQGVARPVLPLVAWLAGDGVDPAADAQTVQASRASGSRRPVAGPAAGRAAGGPCQVAADGQVVVVGRDGLVEVADMMAFAGQPADVLELDGAAADGLVAAINAERAAAGLAAVQPDGRLAAVARDHAVDLYLRGYVSHFSLECVTSGRVDVDGCTDVASRAERAQVASGWVGENVALARSVSATHRGLMASDAHRAAILDGSYHHAGVAVVDGPVGLVTVQVFGDLRTVAQLLADTNPAAYQQLESAGRIGDDGTILPPPRPAR